MHKEPRRVTRMAPAAAFILILSLNTSSVSPDCSPLICLFCSSIDPDAQVRAAVASNPNTRWPILEALAWEFPHAFLHNPVGQVQLLTHPEQISSDELFWEAVLREASIPLWWGNWLHQAPLDQVLLRPPKRKN